MRASAPPNFETWGLSPPKALDGCPKHADVSWHRAGYIRSHFYYRHPCRRVHTKTTQQPYFGGAIFKKHASECTKANYSKSRTYFFWGSMPLGPLNRIALAHTAVLFLYVKCYEWYSGHFSETAVILLLSDVCFFLVVCFTLSIIPAAFYEYLVSCTLQCHPQMMPPKYGWTL